MNQVDAPKLLTARWAFARSYRKWVKLHGRAGYEYGWGYNSYELSKKAISCLDYSSRRGLEPWDEVLKRHDVSVIELMIYLVYEYNFYPVYEDLVSEAIDWIDAMKSQKPYV
jgi:hypothetical protein